MQQVIKGRKSLLQIPFLVAEKGAKKVLLVTGQHLLQDRLFREVCSQLPVPFQVVHPGEGVLQTGAIPQFDDLDSIVAIGGGKVMDFAKGILYQHKKPVFFVAAPTTAGSGSEATSVAVFYEGKEKVSLDAPHLLPQVAILDPALLDSLPPQQRAVSGADALAQCIESIWSKNSSNESEKFALTALEMLWTDLEAFVSEPEVALNERTLWAAYLAGRAIAVTRTTGPHTFSYYLTAHHGVPHGQAVALTLPLFFLYNDDESTKSQMKKIYNLLHVHTGQEAFTACRRLLQSMGLATTLADLHLQDVPLDDWLKSVNQQRFANNPVPFNAEKLKTLFRQYLS